ncbi:MAG TPA: GDSL-type esterase/lipase family protein [Chitinophagaceae bacterium]|nr:GDSL-type esterase/lipase family protein [Chitinophagaceae bacterium]
MRKIILLIPVIVFMAFSKQKKAKVIFFGDSITEAGARAGGYIRRIDTLCMKEGSGDRYEFVGAGISGNKVYDLYLRLEEDVLNKNPDIVFIYVGVNDVWHKRSSGTGTDPDKFEKFYQAIINKLKAKGSKVVLVTPAAIGEKTDFSNEQDGDLNKYCNIIRGIAGKNSLPVVDLRQQLLDYDLKNNPDNKDRGILTTDGVHLNARGNQFVAESMWDAIKKF